MTEPDWMPETIEPTTPKAIVAVPAAGRSDLRGRRLLIGLPGFGWRGDLRGDTAIVQASRTYVPVLPEHEWYRAEAEQIEVFAPLVPIDRVWAEVESPAPVATGTPDIFSRLVSLDEPPRREPIPVRNLSGITGRRLVQADGPTGTARPSSGNRGVSEHRGRHLCAGLHRARLVQVGMERQAAAYPRSSDLPAVGRVVPLLPVLRRTYPPIMGALTQ